MKLQKNGVIKDIQNEKEIGDYIAAGWTKKTEEKKIIYPKSRGIEK